MKITELKWCCRIDSVMRRSHITDMVSSGIIILSCREPDLLVLECDGTTMYYTDSPKYSVRDFKLIFNLLMGTEQIDGFVCPMDMWDGQVQKGALFTVGEDGLYYTKANDKFRFYLPKELVLTWEPHTVPATPIYKIGDWIVLTDGSIGVISILPHGLRLEDISSIGRDYIVVIDGVYTGVKYTCIQRKANDLEKPIVRYVKKIDGTNTGSGAAIWISKTITIVHDNINNTTGIHIDTFEEISNILGNGIVNNVDIRVPYLDMYNCRFEPEKVADIIKEYYKHQSINK